MTQPTGSVEETTAQRGSEYGDWRENGSLADHLIGVVESSPRWLNMSGFARQSVRMMLVKIARICCGNWRNADSWHDIQGYAKITEERLPDA